MGGSSKSGTAKVDAFKLAALKLFDFMVSELPGVPGDALYSEGVSPPDVVAWILQRAHAPYAVL
jgi:hypothetical protein